MPAENYEAYVDRCAVSAIRMVSTCPQDRKCPHVLGYEQPPGVGSYLWDGNRPIFLAY